MAESDTVTVFDGEKAPSKLYSEHHRSLQDRFDSRRMADLMEKGLVHAEFAENEKAFIESRDMFFLSTVDPFGRPTVSYKGGPLGFVAVAGPSSLLFPSYDGNGMHYSLGNIMTAPRIGMLFIDFESPNRLRVQGTASVSFEASLMERYPGADCVVSVAVEEIWINCSRYIHSYRKLESSKYTPQEGKEPPFPAWKRLDFVQPALPVKDQGKAQNHGGEITLDEFMEKAARGDS
jgi:predicted pyridoxine 5'-phosphate oxidase superfamily flavin-nucleotide-binding protein